MGNLSFTTSYVTQLYSAQKSLMYNSLHFQHLTGKAKRSLYNIEEQNTRRKLTYNRAFALLQSREQTRHSWLNYYFDRSVVKGISYCSYMGHCIMV